MTYFLSDYSLSTCERLYVACSLGVLGGFPYAERHWDEGEVNWLHYVIALVEACPYLGGLVALVEYALHFFFVQNPSTQTAPQGKVEEEPKTSFTQTLPQSSPGQLDVDVTSTDPAPSTAIVTPPQVTLPYFGYEIIKSPQSQSDSYAFNWGTLYLDYVEKSDTRGALFAIFQTYVAKENLFGKKFAEGFAKTFAQGFGTQFLEKIQTSPDPTSELMQDWVNHTKTADSTDTTSTAACVVYIDKEKHTLHCVKAPETGTHTNAFSVTVCSVQSATKQIIFPGTAHSLHNEDSIFIHANRHRDHFSQVFCKDLDIMQKIDSLTDFFQQQRDVFQLKITIKS